MIQKCISAMLEHRGGVIVQDVMLFWKMSWFESNSHFFWEAAAGLSSVNVNVHSVKSCTQQSAELWADVDSTVITSVCDATGTIETAGQKIAAIVYFCLCA